MAWELPSKRRLIRRETFWIGPDRFPGSYLENEEFTLAYGIKTVPNTPEEDEELAEDDTPST